jgi:hypothetical protein
MNNYVQMLMVEASAINARIEGMKAENEVRSRHNDAQAYGSLSFFDAEKELIDIAKRIKEAV